MKCFNVDFVNALLTFIWSISRFLIVININIIRKIFIRTMKANVLS